MHGFMGSVQLWRHSPLDPPDSPSQFFPFACTHIVSVAVAHRKSGKALL